MHIFEYNNVPSFLPHFLTLTLLYTNPHSGTRERRKGLEALATTSDNDETNYPPPASSNLFNHIPYPHGGTRRREGMEDNFNLPHNFLIHPF